MGWGNPRRQEPPKRDTERFKKLDDLIEKGLGDIPPGTPIRPPVHTPIARSPVARITVDPAIEAALARSNGMQEHQPTISRLSPPLEAHAAKMRENAERRKRFPWLTNGKGRPADLGRIHRLLVDVVGYDFKPESNEPEFCRPRQVAMWLMREIMQASYPAIARFYSKNHATVMHSVRRVEVNRRTNKQAKIETDQLLSEIRAKINYSDSSTTH